jgi:hypothetical protein
MLERHKLLMGRTQVMFATKLWPNRSLLAWF